MVREHLVDCFLLDASRLVEVYDLIEMNWNLIKGIRT